MQTPAIPLDEDSRIATLRALNILDTEREDRYDRLTRLAMRVFNVPYSTISMIDSHRQWFKSIQGLTLCETSRDISFCAHAILYDEILYVENALKDERFHDNPVVVGEPKIRFYAGCSLQLNGFKMGTFCVLTRSPGHSPPRTGDCSRILQGWLRRNLQRRSPSFLCDSTTGRVARILRLWITKNQGCLASRMPSPFNNMNALKIKLGFLC
jgi:GAF domain-containing protein